MRYRLWMVDPISNEYEIHRTAISAIIELPINESIPSPNANKPHQQHAHEEHADTPQQSCKATEHTNTSNNRAEWRRLADA